MWNCLDQCEVTKNISVVVFYFLNHCGLFTGNKISSDINT